MLLLTILSTTSEQIKFRVLNTTIHRYDFFLIWTIAANLSFIFDLFKEHEKVLQQMMLKKYPSTIVPNTSHQYIF